MITSGGVASVTTEPAPELSTILHRLESLYYEFDVSDDHYAVFEKVKAEFRKAKLPEPYLSAEIEKLQTAMAGHLSHGEVERRLRSGRASKQQSGDIETTMLYDIASHQFQLFQDTTTNLYARFEADSEDNPHYELHPLSSKAIRNYLRNLAKKELNKVVRRDVINTVLEQLQADEATPARLSCRTAQYDGAFYYDMLDQDWSAIKITPGAWEYCYYEYDLPPLFITNSLQAEQAAPDSQATIQDIKKLFDFLGIPGPEEQLLTVVWLISTFIPALKIPILYVYGEKGSGKTFFTKALAQLGDPNVVDPTAQEVKVLAQPRHSEEAITQMAHHHIVAYDNVYSIAGWYSNLLSIRTTGGIAEKKKLYTDSEPYIIRLAGPTILNGIHRRGLQYTDLQDRIIPIRLEKREDNKSEAQYWKQFNEIRSTVLGAILTILSRAMEIEPTLQIRPVSRFVDFERWGCAISQAMNEAGLSYSQGDFIKAYNANIKNVRYSVLEGQPIAQCLIHLRNTAVTNEWAGTPDKLLFTLNTAAASINVDTTQKTWPRNAVWLTRRLDEIRSNLMEIGISYSERKERTVKGEPPKRIIRIVFPSKITRW
jgi:hypothetical protein